MTKDLIPICCVCHRINIASGQWVETAPNQRRMMAKKLTHIYCQECLELETDRFNRELAQCKRYF